MSLDTQMKFNKYHADNPHIYAEFKRMALKAAGRKRKFSARAIFHILRWETEVGGDGEFKVWNDSSPYYARMFEEEYPKHKGFFRMKKILPSEFNIEDDVD